MLFLSFVLQACLTPYQPKEGDRPGYEVISDSSAARSFVVNVDLPKAGLEYKNFYLMRTVGEECQKRGFNYFDSGQINSVSAYGFCYSKKSKKSLALTFDKDELDKTPQSLIVENTNKKTGSSVMMGDQIVEANGKKLASIGQLKKLVYESPDQGLVKLKVMREGQQIQIGEPLITYPGLFGPKDLKALRKKIR